MQDWAGKTDALLTHLGWFCLEKEVTCVPVPSESPGSNTIPQYNAVLRPRHAVEFMKVAKKWRKIWDSLLEISEARNHVAETVYAEEALEGAEKGLGGVS